MGLDNPLHIAFLVVILLLVFGARRLPEIGRSLGTGMREFKESISGESTRAQAEAPQPALGPPAQPQQPSEAAVAQHAGSQQPAQAPRD
jgi:sec-independent protein translocase protein TatA